MTSDRVRLTLLSRTYCHLCHEMAAALAPLAAEFGAVVEVVDVDTDPEIEARWGDKVPVLLCDGREICHYFLDTARVREVLGRVT